MVYKPHCRTPLELLSTAGFRAYLLLLCLMAFWAYYGPESWPIVGFLVVFRPWGPSRRHFLFFCFLYLLLLFYFFPVFCFVFCIIYFLLFFALFFNSFLLLVFTKIMNCLLVPLVFKFENTFFVFFVFFVALFILFCFYLQQNTYCCYF